MRKLDGLQPGRVFYYFEEICNIPHGSENMSRISEYCMNFAEKHSLKAIRDAADNVIIFKEASNGYENAEPVILQGHLDMVCQKETGCCIDFEKDGLDIFIEGDSIKAQGTTLGADNGIAVAMIMAILESDNYAHPPIEALFTTDEEIGMIGATALDASVLKGKKMINLDSEDWGVITVSCAGGSDFVMNIPVKRKTATGQSVKITVLGLKGGHSGVEIHKGRINANILAGRIIDNKNSCDFDIKSISGGDKANAIPNCCEIEIVTKDADSFVNEMKKVTDIILKENAERENDLKIIFEKGAGGEFEVFDEETTEKLTFMLLCIPDGVVDMSAEIDGLVETSLNMGILKTDNAFIKSHFALRSNKKSALMHLERRLAAFASYLECEYEAYGYYPPWEYNDNSELQKTARETFFDKFGYEPKIEAIHAGLECGVLSSKIEDFDCISIGPDMKDVHTVNEKLSIKSTGDTFDYILKILEKCKG